MDDVAMRSLRDGPHTRIRSVGGRLARGGQPMSGRLAGMRAFITAAGAGIGRATAPAFMRQDAEVVRTDIDAATLASPATAS